MQDFEKHLSYGEVKAVAGSKLNGRVRNQDQGDPLVEGDVFTIPTDFMSVCFVKNNLTDFDGNPIQFLLLDVVNEKTGAKKVIHFYPNQLAKVFFPYDEAGNPLPKVKTSGPVTEEYLKHMDDMHEAVKAIAGRAIKVVKDTPLTVRRYQSTDTYTTHCYEYAWAK